MISVINASGKVKGIVSDCIYIFKKKKVYVLIVLVIIECYDHIRTSTLSPVGRKKEKKLVSVCSVSEPSPPIRIECGLPPVRIEWRRALVLVLAALMRVHCVCTFLLF